MAHDTKRSREAKDFFGEDDRLEVGIRERGRTWIEAILQEELAAVLGAGVPCGCRTAVAGNP